MIAGTDPFHLKVNSTPRNKGISKLDKHMKFIIKAFEENGDSIKEICDLLDVNISYLRKYLKNKMGQDWYDNNVNCFERVKIMRETYRESICELKTEGLTVRIIAQRLELTSGRVETWWQYYKKNPI